jgi:hypothetical protein
MARSINSPGVQITETDLSNYQLIGGGTTVLIPGFAPQGPTDEVLLVTSISDFEQIYGTPTTAAERYFYHSAKEVLNSPASLLTTRLPYGSGAGNGFDVDTYSALLYPVASSAAGFQIGAPTSIVIDETQYYNILQNNVTWTSISSTSPTASYELSSNKLNAGIVVLNTSQTSINEYFEGYYVNITDNRDIKVDTDFTSVNNFYSLSGKNSFYSVPTTRLGFALSGTSESQGTGSISETIESIPTYNFSLSSFQDSVIFTLFKVRNSIYEPNTLVYNLAESYIGSLNKRRTGEQNTSLFLENKVNGTSSNIKVFVNPAIAGATDWSGTGNGNIPNKNVVVTDNNRAVYPTGVYFPTYNFANNKIIGNIVTKVSRALSHVSTPDTVLIDVIADAGLSTIAANIDNTTTSTYDDLAYLAQDLSVEGNSVSTKWRNIFNVFNSFVSNTRKDCVYITDPLRQIFVNGNIKTLKIRSSTFTQTIFTPLKNLFSSINSNYSVAYGNWLSVYDAASDQQTWVPSSGFAAAVYARTDTATQPWFAPAGLNRGSLNNINDIAFNPNQKQRDFLYTIGVNPIALFSGDGYVIFGQKTLQGKPSAFDRVNVRRLFLVLERSTQQALKYFVFEPNTEFTRTRLKNTISPVFELAKNTQGVYDYLIVCDERNNTSDVIDRNELAVDIYIKPVKAAEFILVNFIATTTGQDFQELI